ncbi:PACS-1 cytosolic sorting protein [Pelomyxa schiedti]|nr:PACS-1 cytosolic sorting protein [Pelomyxa schiedti]
MTSSSATTGNSLVIGGSGSLSSTGGERGGAGPGAGVGPGGSLSTSGGALGSLRESTSATCLMAACGSPTLGPMVVVGGVGGGSGLVAVGASVVVASKDPAAAGGGDKAGPGGTGGGALQNGEGTGSGKRPVVMGSGTGDAGVGGDAEGSNDASTTVLMGPGYEQVSQKKRVLSGVFNVEHSHEHYAVSRICHIKVFSIEILNPIPDLGPLCLSVSLMKAKGSLPATIDMNPVETGGPRSLRVDLTYSFRYSHSLREFEDVLVIKAQTNKHRIGPKKSTTIATAQLFMSHIVQFPMDDDLILYCSEKGVKSPPVPLFKLRVSIGTYPQSISTHEDAQEWEYEALPEQYSDEYSSSSDSEDESTKLTTMPTTASGTAQVPLSQRLRLLSPTTTLSVASPNDIKSLRDDPKPSPVKDKRSKSVSVVQPKKRGDLEFHTVEFTPERTAEIRQATRDAHLHPPSIDSLEDAPATPTTAATGNVATNSASISVPALASIPQPSLSRFRSDPRLSDSSPTMGPPPDLSAIKPGDTIFLVNGARRRALRVASFIEKNCPSLSSSAHFVKPNCERDAQTVINTLLGKFIPDHPFHVLVLGSDAFLSSAMRPYIEVLANKPRQWEPLELFLIPIGKHCELAQHVCSLDTEYRNLFADDFWHALSDPHCHPAEDDFVEIERRIAVYSNSAVENFKFTIGEAYLAVAGQAAKAFPFIKSVLITHTQTDVVPEVLVDFMVTKKTPHQQQSQKVFLTALVATKMAEVAANMHVDAENFPSKDTLTMLMQTAPKKSKKPRVKLFGGKFGTKSSEVPPSDATDEDAGHKSKPSDSKHKDKTKPEKDKKDKKKKGSKDSDTLVKELTGAPPTPSSSSGTASTSTASSTTTTITATPSKGDKSEKSEKTERDTKDKDKGDKIFVTTVSRLMCSVGDSSSSLMVYVDGTRIESVKNLTLRTEWARVKTISVKSFVAYSL